MKLTPKNFGKVAVLMGGTSSEREISLLSGTQILSALKRKKINAYAINVGPDIIENLQNNKPDRAFIALHGTGGEDGIIQALLNLLKIPYPSSGVAASALTMNKYHCNLLCKAFGIPVLPSTILTKDTENNLSFPLCIKPVSSGSSCGVTCINTPEQLPQAYHEAKKYAAEVMAEPWIAGREFTVAILDKQALPVVEIITPADEFYDYEAKYLKPTTSYICPCDLPQSQQQQLQNLALQAFQATGCKCWARIDFIQDQQENLWLLDINTIPGLTDHSLFPMAAKQAGIEFDDLIWQLLTYTL